MKNIIITVTDDQNSFSHDMEIPADVKMEPVLEKIIGSLSLLYPAYPFYRKAWKYLCRRTKEAVDPELTAEECGIWNGDYLIMEEI